MWSLDGTTARLKTDSLAATLDLRRPNQGLNDVQVALGPPSWQPVETRGLLRICRASGTECDEEIQDRYVRGSDLVVTYAASETNPVNPQIYWRALQVDDVAGAGVELIVSVQTSLLDSNPATSISDVLAADEMFVLRDPNARQFEPLAMDRLTTEATPAPRTAAVFLYRLVGARVTYA